ncbi:MAG TPA: hypothetical protein VFE24_01555 [Pirellulales bacterium]|jgi:hypothetical protein|nr:hypothetical protein [Pirellulales bacterium]
MWASQSEELAGRRGLRFRITIDSRPATYADVIRAWQDDCGFRSLFNSLLAEAPYAAFRWETPAVTDELASRAFEFVLLDSPGLAQHPDPDAFAEHFATARGDIAAFSNLGGDAVLVVPCPHGEPTAYGHLAAFVRAAPAAQRNALWQEVGAALARRVGPKPVWLSTAGAGVSWLHVRLDDWPKYYGYEPYRRPAKQEAVR